jgi:uncharacterized protein (TIGR00730 family)
MKSVCVFSGSSPGVRPVHLASARRIGEALAARGIRLVYGGSSVGLMGAVADAALARGGEVVGVLPEFMVSREIAHPGLTELVLVGSMHERKAQMAARADAFVALPGGFGTLDELFEVLTWSLLGLHQPQKPSAVLDVDGYYASLIAFLDHAVAEGFVRPEHRALLFVDRDPDRLLDRLAGFPLPAVDRGLGGGAGGVRGAGGAPIVDRVIDPSQT